MRPLLDGPARSGDARRPSRPLQPLLRGRRMTPQRLGWLVALASLVADQLSKNLLLYGLGFRALGPAARIDVLPFMNLVMVWNRGVSYGLFQAGSITGTVLLIVFSIVAVVALSWWLMRAER